MILSKCAFLSSLRLFILVIINVSVKFITDIYKTQVNLDSLHDPFNVGSEESY